jgi:hypothetical protein
VAGVEIRHFSGDGICIPGGYNHRIQDCAISSLGRGAIQLFTGDWRNLTDGKSLIENCTISDLSRIDRTYTPGVFTTRTFGITIRNCRFSNMPSSAIRMDGNNIQVELSEFFNCIYESGDQGIIDAYGSYLYRGNTIRWNYFHDTDKGAGVRLDNAISGHMVAENVFTRLLASAGRAYGAIQIHGGRDNHYEGNVIGSTAKVSTIFPWSMAKWTSKNSQMSELTQTFWREGAWIELYPALAWTLDQNTRNHNFYADNVMVKSGKLDMDSTSFGINNKTASPAQEPKKLEEFKALTVPWHPIPVASIGPYTRGKDRGVVFGHRTKEY